MFMQTDIIAQTPLFSSMPATEIKDAAKPAPTAGPFDWASEAYGADSFVFRADIVTYAD